MFIAALFIIARNWKEPKCPSVDEWIQNCGIFTQWSTTQLLETMIFEIPKKMDASREYHPE